MPDPLNISIAGQETSFRPSDALYAELAARGPSLPAVIKRSLATWFHYIKQHQPKLRADQARYYYDNLITHQNPYALFAATTPDTWMRWDTWQIPLMIDALERAEQLVTRHDMTVDDALVQVGLVKE